MNARCARGISGIGAALLLSACEPGVLDPVGPVADGAHLILLDSLGIMLAIVVPTIQATLAVSGWLRAGNKRAEYKPDWNY